MCLKVAGVGTYPPGCMAHITQMFELVREELIRKHSSVKMKPAKPICAFTPEMGVVMVMRYA